MSSTSRSSSFTLHASLSPVQREAVTAPLESRLVLAGPGTGKTRTLVHRIAYLISELHVPAEAILTVTYTNKATEEMRRRLRDMLPDDAQRLTVGTFHAFCIRLLRADHDLVKLPKHFAVTDEDGQVEVLRRVVSTIKDRRDARSLLTRLSAWRLRDAQHQAPLSAFEQSALDGYLGELRRQALIDFDDILLLTERLLIDHPETLAACRSRFRAVLVDEFQDTDIVQYRILKRLAGKDIPVFAVADDDQSIFAWRGAHPRNLRHFVSDFLPDDGPGSVVKLEENYRCSGAVVEAANRLIAGSLRLFDKLPTSKSVAGEPVRLFVHEDEEAEAFAVAEDIRDAVADGEGGAAYREAAILYRNHRVGELLEAVLLGCGIPCQVVRGASVFDAPRIRKALALMRVHLNPQDEISLRTLLTQFLDDLVLNKIEDHAVRRSCGLRRALWDCLRDKNLSVGETRQLERVVGLLNTARTLAEDAPTVTLAEWVRGVALFLEAGDSTAESEASQGDRRKIGDPLAVPVLETGAKWLERLAERKGRLVVAGADERFERAAVALLGSMIGDETLPTVTLDEHAPDESSDAPCLLLALDPAGETRALKRGGFTAVLALHARKGDSNLRRVVVPPSAVPAEERGPAPSVFAAVWKLAQAFLGLRRAVFLPGYTVVDLETTDLDTERNDMVEIAAARVRDGRIAAEFSRLVKPSVPIAPAAQAVHRIGAAEVAAARSFEDEAAALREFLGTDTLVAHNGLGFDFPVLLRRFADARKRRPEIPALSNLLFDSLPLARELYPDAQKATLEALAARFGVDPGNSHRALDDVRTLVHVLERMKADYAARGRARNGLESLGLLAAAMLLETDVETARRSPLFRLGCVEWNIENVEDIAGAIASPDEDDPNSIRDVIRETVEEQTDNQASREASRDAENEARFIEILRRYDGRPLSESMREFVDFTRLFQQQDSWKDRNAVTLMTIHAAKGLEFPYVWVVALEQGVLPSYQSTVADQKVRTAKIDEERRLLYVAMTRAQRRLTLSRALRRRDPSGQYRDAEPSMFLASLGLKETAS